jgi:hypothetical protein
LKSLKLMLDRRFVIAETMDPSGSLRSAVATASVDLIVIVKVHLEVTRWGGGCQNLEPWALEVKLICLRVTLSSIW